jgi:outer membrane protein assembly factor BamA
MMLGLRFLLVTILLGSCFFAAAQAPAAQISNGQYLVSQFEITGNKKTKDYIVIRESNIKVGDTLSFQQAVAVCKRSEELLASTRLFVLVKVYPEIINESQIKIVVELKERWYVFPVPYFKLAERNFNVWLRDEKASLKRVNYGLKLNWYNFSGRNDKVKLYAYTGFNQLFSAEYAQPYADGSLTWGYDVKINIGRDKQAFSYSDENKPVVIPVNSKGTGFNHKFTNVELSFTYRKKINSLHQLGFRYNSASISDSIINANARFFAPGVKSAKFFDAFYRFNYNKVDYIPYPLKGTILKVELQQRMLNSNVNNFQLNALMFNGIPLGKDFFFNTKNGFVVKSQKNLSYINSLFLGYGEYYLRGMERLVADGQYGYINRNTLVKRFLNTTLKLPIKAKWIKSHKELPIKLMFNTFFDNGYVYNKNIGTSVLNNKFIYGYGAGLDILAAYDFLIRIDYSFNSIGQSGVVFKLGLNF